MNDLATPTARFDNRQLRELPAEDGRNPRPHQVFGAAYSLVEPTPVAAPRLLGWSDEMGTELGIARPQGPDDPWLQALAGNRRLPGMETYAMCYGGHQFGNWAGQLGDGRVIGLGELVNEAGRRWELQLKGAGPTPYSRTADGRAVLRSSLREFLCSEAMHHLGVPTTRALSLVGTGESVVRDMFYDGHPEPEPGAIVCRVARSFLRFGHFELPASRQDHALLRRLVDFAIAAYFPDLDPNDPNVIAHWFRQICERTADLMVDWMAVGFVHGVMNTDNLSILGETIDYGPYGWLEPYDPQWTPNTTDAQGRRYSYGQQPAIAQWNLSRLGSALALLVDDVAPLQAALEAYAPRFNDGYRRRFARKLGLASWQDGDDALLEELQHLLQATETDFCLFFRRLSRLVGEDAATDDPIAPLREAYYQPEAPDEPELKAQLSAWLDAWQQRLTHDGEDPATVRARMDAVNPKYVLRNYLAQQAIDAATAGDTGELERLQTVLRRPYDEQPEYEPYAARRPEWARHKAGCSALSCSS